METDASQTAENAASAAASSSSAEGSGEGLSFAEQLAAANARADDNHAKLLYALADFENYKKRSERQLSERLNAGKRATLAKFLPVLDNLERALAFEQDSSGLRGGLAATQRGFEALLSSEDVKPLNVLGTPFDPRVAEAIGTREADGTDDNIVVEEVQRGYTIGDELLRPARVIVSERARRAESQDDAAAHDGRGSRETQ